MQYFGAQVLPRDSTEFRLWAPAARSVELVLNEQLIALPASADGWYAHVEQGVGAGTCYSYRINCRHNVPDPASCFQPADCEGVSEVIDHSAYSWSDGAWRGRPWTDAVIYELHVGSFSAGGTYRDVIEKLPYLAQLGVTAIELMPLSDFYGRRNWGYDGVLPYAPDSSYGRPEELKALIDAAHGVGIMMFLDVVYNHFGPKGNYLSLYAPQFFTERHKTPWGDAIDFSNPCVRAYFVQNACYWLREYHFDGLRLDAVQTMIDDSPRHILLELRDAVGECSHGREVHLILENDANQARYLGPGKYTAQWNDDCHHALHVLATGERDGYYQSYTERPAEMLARCLVEGYAYQGQVSRFTGQPRGEPSAHLPPSAFVNFLQNHDQIGNRAMGERLISLTDQQRFEFVLDILLLAPSPPLLFMGEEWGCRQPFVFFCDFPGELGESVRMGRCEEFARFASFADPHTRAAIPDPLADVTFERCRLRWQDLNSMQAHAWLQRYRQLLDTRRREICPRRYSLGRFRMLHDRAFEAIWDELRLVANCGPSPLTIDDTSGRLIWGKNGNELPAWSLAWRVMERA